MKRNPTAFWAVACLLLAVGAIAWVVGRQGPHRAALRALRAQSPALYFDVHGNGCEELRLLMRERFAATSAICEAIEQEPPGSSELKGALFIVLGFVKDAASIPWLEERLDGPDAGVISRNWLGLWRGFLDSDAPRSDKKWLTGGDAWAAFFRRWIARPDALAARPALIRVLTDWFHDPATVATVEALEGSLTDGEDILIAQLYLKRHGRAPDRVRLLQAMARLGGKEEGDRVLFDFARELKHEAFVPWLVAHADQEAARDALRATTFVLGIGGRGNWEEWHRRHGAESRAAWMAAAVKSFEDELALDEGSAATYLEKAVQYWNDILLLPSMERWAARPALERAIMWWVDLTYHPAHREPLRELAAAVLAPSSTDWALDIMKDLGFMESDPEDTWERHVRFSNSKV